MSAFPRNRNLDNIMVEECVAKYMTNAEKKHECVRHPTNALFNSGSRVTPPRPSREVLESDA